MFETEQVYDDNAHKWLRLDATSLSDFTARPFVFEACGDLNGRSVLDLGCGEGYCARELKRRGAGACLGVDLSAQMIAAAKSQEAKDDFGIEYRVCDVLDFVPEDTFDLCIAVFLFNYLNVTNMQTVFRMVFDALPEKGEFIFSVPHPMFPFLRTEQKAPFYFDGRGKNYFTSVNEQLEGEIWKRSGEPLHVQCVHKTFSDYFSCLAKAGFSRLPEVTELTVTQDLVDADPDFFAPLQNTPLHVMFKVAK